MTDPLTTDGLLVCAGAGAVVAAAVTRLVVPLTIGLSRRLGVIDEPGERSSHTVPTPRLGGIGVLAGALTGLAAVLALVAATGVDLPTAPLLAVGGTAAAFGAIGLADDLLRGIPVAVRLAGQVVVAALLAPAIAAVAADAGLPAPWALAAIAASGVVAFVNAFNFMDGVDGISGFVTVVVGVDLVVVGWLTGTAALVPAGLVVAGAAAGFLPLNLRPATVFLGDGGSYFLGGWLAVAVAAGIAADVPAVALLAALAPYLADTSVTLVRRLARGDDWRASHHEHTYQRLVELGWSHRAVAGVVAAASATCATVGLLALVSPAGGAVAAVTTVALAAAYVMLPAWVRPPGRAGIGGAASSGRGAHR